MKRLETYGILGILKLVIFKIRTFFTLRNARLIRFPFELRGKKFMQISAGFTCGPGCRIEAYPDENRKVLFIGNNVQLNDYVHITAIESVNIGDNVLMASKIYISDSSHGSYTGDEYDSSPDSVPAERPLYSKPVVIEDNVWLGEFVSVLAGVTIGKGSIIGANSVVSRSIPPNVIAVGSPAKPIKEYNFETRKWEKYR
ncbi:MAG: acetyltransferase [Kaistella sp.]|nr:acetyltransferase [Kaistella sp.]